MTTASGYCAIDFGTSNSAIAIAAGRATARMRLVELEPGQRTMPTAVFYAADGGLHGQPQLRVRPGRGRGLRRRHRRPADALDEEHPRQLADRADAPTSAAAAPSATSTSSPPTCAHLRRRAEAEAGVAIGRAVLGRPVFFVDDDPARDAQAERALRSGRPARRLSRGRVPVRADRRRLRLRAAGRAARRRCWSPTSAAAPPTSRSSGSGPAARRQAERKADILANHGVHVAGTDFDRRVELASVLPLLGYRAFGVASADQPAREVPSAVYFDLATWHLINTVYNPLRVAELRGMRSFYADPAQHRRLMSVVDQPPRPRRCSPAPRPPRSPSPKAARRRSTSSRSKRGWRASFDEAGARAALDADLDRIVAAARETAAQAGLARRRDRRALLHRRLDRPAPADRAAAAGVSGGAAGARRPLRQRRQRAGAACGAALRRRRLSGEESRARDLFARSG